MRSWLHWAARRRARVRRDPVHLPPDVRLPALREAPRLAMPPPTSTRPATTGWLARALVTAERNLRDAESQVEGFLTSLFPDGWRGWAFQRGDSGHVEIDVYQAVESPAAVAALHRAGFGGVRIHQHEASKFITCACRTHEAA
jgi:hypothetical protein